MSQSNLKSQLQQLIKAKEYKAAIVLLEASDLPDKTTFIARIKKRMAEDAPEVEVKATSEAEKRLPFQEELVKGKRRRGWKFYAGVTLLVVCMAITGFAAYVAAALPGVEARIGVSLYCSFWLDRDSGCKEFTDGVMQQWSDIVMQCYYDSGRMKYDALFYTCLKDAGIQ